MTAMTAITGKKARLLDLVTGVLEMTRDGTRDIDEVSEVLQFLKDDPNFARYVTRYVTGGSKRATGNIFPIVCEGGKKATELARLGRYDDWSKDITDDRFPLAKHEPEERVIELIEFNYDPTSKDVLREFAKRGLERPTAEDALCFGIQYPKEQVKRPIVFLHEPVLGPDSRRFVLILDGVFGYRELALGWFDSHWFRGCAFAAVRK